MMGDGKDERDMNNPNRKRPYESIAINDEEPSERGPHRHSEIDDSCSADCSDEECCVDVPVISELRKALDYLVSVRYFSGLFPLFYEFRPCN